jgi:hypothetical protein
MNVDLRACRMSMFSFGKKNNNYKIYVILSWSVICSDCWLSRNGLNCFVEEF